MDEENMMLIEDKEEKFAISFELLCLLRWIIDNEPDKLKKLVSKAVARGLKERINRIQQLDEPAALDDAHENMIEFFSALDTMLNDSIQEELSKTTCMQNFIPVLAHLDSQSCDDNLIKKSMEKVDSFAWQSEQGRYPQELLLQEILRNWKPTKSNEQH